MALRERIADHVYVFRSQLYAQVNAGLIATDEGCVLIDTLPFPQETAEIAEFVRERLRSRVRYIILTHSHADHVYGAYLFPKAEVVSHLLTRELMIKQTRPALIQARQRNTDLADVSLRLPSLLIEREATIRIGNFTLVIRHSPGHAPDCVTVYVKEDKILFASDTVMPVPYFVNGNLNDLRRSLVAVLNLTPVEDVVQGHGEVLLRGEVQAVLGAQIDYLKCVDAHITKVIAAGGGKAELESLQLEDCGMTRGALGGLVVQLHQGNLAYWYAHEKRRLALREAVA